MSSKKVAILLSTYNGEKYLPELLDSICKQTYENIELIIRDDGSADETISCIENREYPFPIQVFNGDNLGFCKSFISLLETANADYYSFADQDDIWYPEKIEKAVEWLETQQETEPLLYHCGYDIIDDEKNKIGEFLFSDENFDFRRSLTENHYSGFCMVINNSLRELILQGDPEKYVFHDWWAAILVQAFGVAHFDSNICAAHRAHKYNVTRQTLLRKMKWFFDGLFRGSDTKRRNMEFCRLFGDSIKDKDKKILSLFCDTHYHFAHAVKKAFYPKRWRPDIPSEFAIRFLMLVGRI